MVSEALIAARKSMIKEFKSSAKWEMVSNCGKRRVSTLMKLPPPGLDIPQETWLRRLYSKKKWLDAFARTLEKWRTQFDARVEVEMEGMSYQYLKTNGLRIPDTPPCGDADTRMEAKRMLYDWQAEIRELARLHQERNGESYPDEHWVKPKGHHGRWPRASTSKDPRGHY